ncbi:MAG: FumA C-terminus/TtdB family hydratase beta subunit [Ardenticatenia bacterium]|nr:FumA C-terminus/TtdB family hydratase beta subunit [Ardenticatenia bacterium]
MTPRPLRTPLTDEDVANVRAGDMVLISGTLYTARDAAHQRLVAALAEGHPPPIPLAGQVIYYVGPAPAPPGRPIGPAGPTTSGRMDPYTIPLLERGVKGFIGKGHRSPPIKAAFVRYRAVYFATVGGAALLLADHIVEARVVAYEDLGPEAIHELVVRDFPAIVVNDIYGGDAYESPFTTP